MSSSGRERGRSRGRGSGRGSGRGRSNRTSTTSKKKTVADYQYYLGSAKTASDYETTTEFLINHIRKTYNYGDDIATALEKQEPYKIDQHKPKLSFSTNADKAAKEAENRQFEFKYKAELDVYHKRKAAYKTNVTKSYAFLWEQCSKGMQIKIKANKEYATTIKGNPIELIKAIKLYALNFQEH